MALRRLLQFCPDCGGSVFNDEELGEDVCVCCGLVLGIFVQEDDRVPFGEEYDQYSPSNQLDLRRNLGADMSSHDLWTILQTRSLKDVPFRFNLMRNMALFDNNTCLKKMLIYGSELCTIYSLGTDVRFSN